MQRKVTVGVSNRHVHLTESVYNQLFDEPIKKRNDLHQIGEFASEQVVIIQTEKGILEKVRVLGPFRDYNQVEIANSDAYKLGINPPVRRSGDLNKSETVTLVTDKGSVILENSCILAERHVHITPSLASELGVIDGQIVKILVGGDKSCILDVHVKISDNGYFEVHIDMDDANSAGLKNGDEVLLVF